MSLAKILKNPFFLKDREELLNYQLYYEIKKIGLENNVDFELLEPIIDKNGYDLLIKFRNFSKPIQIKCAERNGTQSWKINKHFFRPSTLKDAATILNIYNAGHIGLGGGVIIIEYFVNDNGEVDIKYFYSDFVYLSFYQRNVRPWLLQSNYVDYISNIFDDSERKFNLPKSLFKEITIEQFLYLARIFPTTQNLSNVDLWTTKYPPISEILKLQEIKIIDKEIKIMLSSGELVQSCIHIRDIFDYGLRNYSINGKLTI